MFYASVLYFRGMRDGCGIYLIEDPKRGLVYVGATGHYRMRKGTHRNRLKNRTASKRLQEAYDLNDGNLLFQLVELCPHDKLLERERVWVSKFNAEDLLNDKEPRRAAMWTT